MSMLCFQTLTATLLGVCHYYPPVMWKQVSVLATPMLSNLEHTSKSVLWVFARDPLSLWYMRLHGHCLKETWNGVLALLFSALKDESSQHRNWQAPAWPMLRVPVPKPDYLWLIPRTHVVEKEPTLTSVCTAPPYTHTHTHSHTHTQTQHKHTYTHHTLTHF